MKLEHSCNDSNSWLRYDPSLPKISIKPEYYVQEERNYTDFKVEKNKDEEKAKAASKSQMLLL